MPQVSTRSAVKSSTQLKEECFVCGKSRNKKGHWKLVLISTTDRQNSVWTKAKELNDENMLRQLQGFGNSCIDMVASDFRYHRTCHDSYMMKTPADSGPKPPNTFDAGFLWMVSYINDTLAENKDCVLFPTKLRDMYRQWLSDHGVDNAMSYRSSQLNIHLQNYYDSPQGCQIMIMPRK